MPYGPLRAKEVPTVEKRFYMKQDEEKPEAQSSDVRIK